MAESTPISTPTNDTNAVAESSYFRRTVCLYDWWLVRAQNDFQGKRLAVAGVSSRKEEAIRVFVSAPVIKRYDVFNLETADGIYVIINGFINEQRTLENGFSPEVFNRFIFGFPSNWESYVIDCFREESTTDIDLGGAVSDNVIAIRPEILSDEKSIPTPVASPEEATVDHEKPFPEGECNASKEMGGVNVAYGSCRSKRSARLHNIDVCQQKKQPASGGLPKYPDEEKSSTSAALENCDGEQLKSPVTPIQSRSHEKPFSDNECNASKEKVGVNVACGSSGSRHSARLRNITVCQQRKQPASGGLPKYPDEEKSSTSAALENCDGEQLKSPVTPILSRSHEKPFSDNECNASKEKVGVNVAYGSSGSRHSASLRNITVCQQRKQPASGGLPKYPDEEKSSTSAALENCDGERLKSPVTPIQSQSHEKPFSDDECNASKEMGGVNVACGGSKSRRSARLRNIKVCQQNNQPASGGPPKYPDKEKRSNSVALENHDGEGLKIPVTPSESQSQGQVNTSSQQLAKKSVSRISGTLSAKTEGCYKKKPVTVKTKGISPKRKMTKSASAVKYPRVKDVSPLIKGGKRKISSVSPESLSFRKSRSGRLLLPPLEFWRNQIPVYNADHEITEIQEGASVVWERKE
ncbi:kinetochore-associated protein KNL-2 homolog isoform X2 [Gastrolobium bilobum]|uniref:kinetochore-associated protein KNL-2 homolog isoform X2 n=1 Tax=Gastrolobium bilobum TaxID=150636 RepID=UPI002AAFE44A|nr:kinetochore-associated protein KNL-2 homolog isoform X2 [Gastrolobium bilobum]